ncbi:unnamed protein product, partial [marine sediment metagenome]
NDNNKARYIGYRASGFTVREAVKLVGIHQKTLSRWRDPDSPWYDAGFVDAENKLSELRKTLGVEYAHLEFLRNYRLVLEKDFRIIAKSIDQPLSLTGQEQQYLLKARGHYTSHIRVGLQIQHPLRYPTLHMPPQHPIPLLGI